jgi:hypothetical protein
VLYLSLPVYVKKVKWIKENRTEKRKRPSLITVLIAAPLISTSWPITATMYKKRLLQRNSACYDRKTLKWMSAATVWI